MRKVLRRFKKLFFKTVAYLLSKNARVFDIHIHGLSIFTSNTFFGSNANFNGCRIYGSGKVSFGDNFHSGKNLRILTTYHNYLGARIPYDETVITKDVAIGDNVWVGLDVIILAGVTIGEGAIIQAGSVVSSNIPPMGIAGGNPARVFKERDSAKYYKLKEQKQFF
ncbi:acyltransferase [Echinicola shivajiensis]|uniref:acyltransferase n=1 Tax=Echinicola shivajiensis TaxID=1035916 RepID=UPI001BFC86CD|nr:acyltransferase [Echinicola shivajiensis]